MKIVRTTNDTITFRRGWQLITFFTEDYYTRQSVVKTHRFPNEKYSFYWYRVFKSK